MHGQASFLVLIRRGRGCPSFGFIFLWHHSSMLCISVQVNMIGQFPVLFTVTATASIISLKREACTQTVHTHKLTNPSATSTTWFPTSSTWFPTSSTWFPTSSFSIPTTTTDFLTRIPVSTSTEEEKKIAFND